jgi:hypothetical protein
MVLTCGTVQLGQDQEPPTVSFDDPAITATVTGVSQITYAVPGNSYPGPVSALSLEVQVANTASLGLHGVYVTNRGQAQGPAMPALLNVVAAGTIPSPAGPGGNQ